MDKQQSQSPRAPAVASAPRPASAPTTVKARVRPLGRYGPHRAGDVIDVDPKELVICKHVLVALDAEGDEQQAQSVALVGNRGDTSHFRAARANGRESARMMRESQKQRRIAELQALGIEIVTKAAAV